MNKKLIALIGILLIIFSVAIYKGRNIFNKVNFKTNSAAVITADIIQETNSSREREGREGLVVNTQLEQSALLKINDMIDKEYFAHVSPEGVEPWVFFKDADYNYALAGENLAVNFNESKEVVEAWLNSPTHRENMLNEKYKEIGIAIAEGKYKGKKAIFVVEHLGTAQVEAASEKLAPEDSVVINE